MRRFAKLMNALIFISTLSFSSCFIFKTIPIPEVPKPSESGKTSPTPSTVIDPDNLKVYFEKPTSAVYLNEFKGVARAEAKTHPSTKPTKYYNAVGDVLKNLPTDSYMRRIGVGDKTPRTVDEDYNVFIRKAYIFFISEEEDQDYHLIIGDLDEKGDKINLMTAEISGLPKGETNTFAYHILERTRRQLYEKYSDFFLGTRKTYTPRTQFPEIAIRGSLFFDNRHSAGQVGSGAAKPNTVWEIHPVTFIEFK